MNRNPLAIILHTDYFFAEGLDFLNECSGYDTKQADGKVPVMLEVCGMWRTPLLSSLPSLLWPGMVATDRVLSIGQIELYCVLMLN